MANPPSNRDLERFAGLVAEYWTDQIETDSGDPEGVVAWEVADADGALVLRPRNRPRPMP